MRTRSTLKRKDWLKMPPQVGVVTHDVHREEPASAASTRNASMWSGGTVATIS